MSAALIIDCSVAMAWLFKDEATDKTTEIRIPPASFAFW